jgi:hypothetical protein
MNKFQMLPVCVLLIISISILQLSGIYAQSQSTPTGYLKTIPGSGNNSVSVSASVIVEVRNETLGTKANLLRTSVSSILASGPSVLKFSDSDQHIIKTKISNTINNSTQSVEGADATYAILGIEINKALQTLVSSSTQPNQTAVVTIETSSVCILSATITCENKVKLS